MANLSILQKLGLILLIVALAWGWDQLRPKGGTGTPIYPTEREAFTEDDLTYQGKTLIVTKHARCRMGCRKLDDYEVQEVINGGKINARKNKPAQGDRCKSIAYEGSTTDGQRARVIVGACEDRPVLITVIDLGRKHQCSCD